MRKSNWVQSILTVLILLVVPMIGNASVLGYSLDVGLDYQQLMPDIPAVDGLVVSHQDDPTDVLNIPAETVILNEGSCLSYSSADYLKTDRATFYGYVLTALGNLPYEVGWRKVVTC